SGEIFVMSGPFKGMKYYNEVVWGSITPKWLGSYEFELHRTILEISNRGYTNFIDIGAAEGYYAVGLASLDPNLRIYTFDTDPYARRLQKKLAHLNGSKNITIGKYCTYKKINQLATTKTILICDIEGYEYQLLDPDRAEGLLHCDILVEVHGFTGLQAAEVERILVQRFKHSHRIQRIASKVRCAKDWQNTCGYRLSNQELTIALNEHRSNSQCWLWLTTPQ
ncbi:MAG: hypothetical protein KDJ97_38235, partial [Anaerolineae bacterium]|nr:hypothetical protein [Anaerolineae bacterium]